MESLDQLFSLQNELRSQIAPEIEIKPAKRKTPPKTKKWSLDLKALTLETSLKLHVLKALSKDLILPLSADSFVKFKVLPSIRKGPDVKLQTAINELPYPTLSKSMDGILDDLSKSKLITTCSYHIDTDPSLCQHDTILLKRDRNKCRKMYKELLPEEEENLNLDVLEPPRKRQKIEGVDDILKSQSVLDRGKNEAGKELTALLGKPTAMDNEKVEAYKSVAAMAGGSAVREFCAFGTKEECRKQRAKPTSCPKIHFIRIIQDHTQPELGDCSYLDGCRNMHTCRYIHYQLDDSVDTWEEQHARDRTISVFNTVSTKHKYGPQYINCDVRNFPFSVLGKFSVIMADPPWDIHMELPYGTLTDTELLNLPVAEMATDGVICLWITGRVVELARKCLKNWGYDCIQELIWIKTNQLQRLIRTGRTGHWINHSKEHCLVGFKGNPDLVKKIDCDVIVSEVRATSRKPDEIYGILERLCPGATKVEIFGREHNCRPGWMTLGNQFTHTRILDTEIRERFKKTFPGFPVSNTIHDDNFKCKIGEAPVASSVNDSWKAEPAKLTKFSH